MTIKFDDYLMTRMQDLEYRNEWLRVAILEYINDGDYSAFFNALEAVIKAQTTVSEFSKKIGMNRVQLIDILHGRTKNPSLPTIGKILAGLGYTLDIKSA